MSPPDNERSFFTAPIRCLLFIDISLVRGLPVSDGFTVGAGRHAGSALKYSGEIMEAPEAKLLGNLCDIPIAVQKHAFGPGNL